MSYDEAAMEEPFSSPANGGEEDDGEAPVESSQGQKWALPPFGYVTECPKCMRATDKIRKDFHRGITHALVTSNPCEGLLTHGVELGEHLCRICTCGYGWCEATYSDRSVYALAESDEEE